VESPPAPRPSRTATLHPPHPHRHLPYHPAHSSPPKAPASPDAGDSCGRFCSCDSAPRSKVSSRAQSLAAADFLRCPLGGLAPPSLSPQMGVTPANMTRIKAGKYRSDISTAMPMRALMISTSHPSEPITCPIRYRSLPVSISRSMWPRIVHPLARATLSATRGRSSGSNARTGNSKETCRSWSFGVTCRANS